MLNRLTISLALLAALSTPLLAQGRRPDARQMTCGQVQALIDERGAVVLTTGTHTYERYVASGQFCQMGEAARPDGISTRDNGNCLVYNCEITGDGDSLFDRF